MVNKSEGVDIVQLIYFIPALVISIWIASRHGVTREAGWLYLLLLSLARILGASFSIAAFAETSNISLWIAAYVLSGIGAAFLVAAFTGIVNRIDTNAQLSPLPPTIRRYLQLMALVSVILSIVGGTQQNKSLSQAAIILFMIQFLVSVFVLSYAVRNMHAVLSIDKILVFICIAAAPFVLIRLIYSICTSFANRNSRTWGYFSNTLTAVALRGILGTVMEIMATTFYIIGGLKAQKLPKAHDNEPQIHSNAHKHSGHR